MHREDNSKFLLYIEPDPAHRSEHPVDDYLTELMSTALAKAKTGTSNYSSKDEEMRFNPDSGYKGFHRTECGQTSDCHDYLLENGMVTNSLCIYYLRHYRDVIPPSEMLKVGELAEYYGVSQGDQAKKLVRTLVRVTEVTDENVRMLVPALGYEEIVIDRSELPDEINKIVHPGKRLHVKINLGDEEGADNGLDGWETT